MGNPLLSVFSGLTGSRRPVETVIPRRTFEDVILPKATRQALDQALVHVTSHDLIFNRWGLGERHPTGLALAFNFAGPPGTGKTICAEAIANALGRRLLVVRYAEVESLWMGQTPKNVSAVFRRACEDNAVLLFDEGFGRQVAVKTANLRVRHFAVGAERAVFVDDVEQYETGRAGLFLAGHEKSPIECL